MNSLRVLLILHKQYVEFLYNTKIKNLWEHTGNGPVEALDLALRHALQHDLQAINNIKLIDYRVRVINPENKTSAKFVFLYLFQMEHTAGKLLE